MTKNKQKDTIIPIHHQRDNSKDVSTQISGSRESPVFMEHLSNSVRKSKKAVMPYISDCVTLCHFLKYVLTICIFLAWVYLSYTAEIGDPKVFVYKTWSILSNTFFFRHVPKPNDAENSVQKKN